MKKWSQGIVWLLVAVLVLGAIPPLPVTATGDAYGQIPWWTLEPIPTRPPETAAELGFFPITSASDLNMMRWNPSADFRLMRNISLPYGWEPIGTADAPFTGTFDGQCFTISGLRINDEHLDDVGLFGVISGATIQNLTIRGSIRGNHNVGALAGRAVRGSTIINVTNYANVHGFFNVGGIVGAMGDAVVTHYRGSNFGASPSGYVSMIMNSTNHGEVFGRYKETTHIFESVFLGGIVGQICFRVTIQNALNTGRVGGIGTTLVGGIVGNVGLTHTHRHNVGVYILNSANTGNIVGLSRVGGIAGALSNATVQGSFNTGDVTTSALDMPMRGATSWSPFAGGGIAGSIVQGTRITHSYNTGNVTSLGAFAEIRDPHNRNATIIVHVGGGSVGGIVGTAHGEGRTTIRYTYNTGAVTSAVGDSGWERGRLVGGIIGATTHINSAREGISQTDSFSSNVVLSNHIHGNDEFSTVRVIAGEASYVGSTIASRSHVIMADNFASI